MEHLGPLLLDVWREACRHIEIAEFTQTIATILSPQMPVGAALVRRIERERACLETVAVGLAGAGSPPLERRTDFTPSGMKRLLAWCRQRGVLRRAQGERSAEPVAHVVPRGIAGDWLLGPLGSAESPAGVLIVAAAGGSSFTDRHERLMQSLLEPFSAALENDRRLRELATLRAAAEADKRSLLTRLGRQELADTIVGAEAGLHAVMERVELVARSDAPVLLIGDTGTGKELIARAIHIRSSRLNGPFLRVNCGAIPSELIDSQLFGHERGAFTGAVERRQGWFERADGGTLFLDEIGDLPLAAQVRLLRILQDGWLERVGSHEPVHVDVRIVAATHRDLPAMVGSRAFREDLWYRISVFPIILPKLAERPDDIPALAEHFAVRAATRFGLALALPTEEDIALLKAYSWPGNVREMASVIDRAAILGNGRRLEIPNALGVPVAGALPAPPLRAEAAPEAAPGGGGRNLLPLGAAMKQHIEAALRITRGRIEGRYGAARLLEINPHTLRARMRKLGIVWRAFRG